MKQRSEGKFIRKAVEQSFDDTETKEFERQLVAAYAAYAEMNRALAAEFASADPKGL